MTDRDVIQALLQEMTESYSTFGDGFSAAMKHFNITTTCTYEKHSPEDAEFFGEKLNYGVIVHTPDTPDYGTHYEFASREERSCFIEGLQVMKKGEDHA